MCQSEAGGHEGVPDPHGPCLKRGADPTTNVRYVDDARSLIRSGALRVVVPPVWRTRRVVLLCDSLEHFGDTQMTLDQCEASRFSGATEGKDDTQSSKSSKEKYTGRPLKKKKQKQKQPANQRRGKKAFVAVVAAGEGHSSANETTVGGDSGG
eukprot:CAMPEP_0185777322 /NCGR_PEP_ID=MMETSP1174-20130828/89012_1 /TAXON_ID=35687 /ORGANISM="Dictyocha speculum, Strain CCMP1381" /LENGTH=152 /DNA_ID=CAMNT_0028465647 /DNA_START=21 /DNA_END=475 /DNA_ORIENTATION=-